MNLHWHYSEANFTLPSRVLGISCLCSASILGSLWYLRSLSDVTFTGRHQIIAMMKELDLFDVFRKMHPNKKSFTYESAARNLKSRIDFFLVAKSIACQVAEAGTKTSITPDHTCKHQVRSRPLEL